jgi:hypothetical protein
MSFLIPLLYGLAFGHCIAGYLLYAEYPRFWKVFLVTMLFAGFMYYLQPLRVTGD